MKISILKLGLPCMVTLPFYCYRKLKIKFSKICVKIYVSKFWLLSMKRSLIDSIDVSNKLYFTDLPLHHYYHNQLAHYSKLH